jgi:hypothetical protein
MLGESVVRCGAIYGGVISDVLPDFSQTLCPCAFHQTAFKRARMTKRPTSKDHAADGLAEPLVLEYNHTPDGATNCNVYLGRNAVEGHFKDRRQNKHPRAARTDLSKFWENLLKLSFAEIIKLSFAYIASRWSGHG